MPTINQLSTIALADLDGTEEVWTSKNGIDYKVTTDTLHSYISSQIYSTYIVIPTAQVLTLNSAPLEIVAAPGAGKTIQVISAAVYIDYNSIAYATNTDIQLITNGLTYAQSVRASVLATTVEKFVNIPENNAAIGAAVNQMTDNAALMVSVPTGDPTAGDSDIEVTVLYRIVE